MGAMAGKPGSQRNVVVLLDLERPGRGRPGLLTPEIHQGIVDRVRKSGKHNVAANACGIGPSTMSHWLDRGIAYARHLGEGGDASDVEVKYLNFAIDVAQAEADHHDTLIATIYELGNEHEVITERITEVAAGQKQDDGTTKVSGDVKQTRTIERRRESSAATLIWLAERLHPELYARLTRNEISGPDGAPIETESTVNVNVRDESRERVTGVLAALATTQRGVRPELGEGDRPGDVSGDDVVVDAEAYEVPPPHTNGKATGVPPPQ